MKTKSDCATSLSKALHLKRCIQLYKWRSEYNKLHACRGFTDYVYGCSTNRISYSGSKGSTNINVNIRLAFVLENASTDDHSLMLLWIKLERLSFEIHADQLIRRAGK
jgi:hypothetical protein